MPLSKLEILRDGVVEKQEVHAIEVVEFLLVKGADVLEELCGHVPCSPGACGRRGEAHLVVHSCQLQYVVGVLLQCLVLAHDVVVNEAGVAQRMHLLPVFVKGLLSLRGGIYEIVDKLLEGHVVAPLQSLGLRVGPVPPDDLCAVAFVESCVIATSEFIAIRRHKALERLPHKEELQVGAQTLVYLGRGVLRQGAEVSRDVGFVGRDRQRVTVGPCHPGQHHEDTLPVGAGHFGNVAVQQSVLVVDDDVFEVFRDEHSAFSSVGATALLQHLPPALMGRLHRRLHLKQTQKRNKKKITFISSSKIHH